MKTDDEREQLRQVYQREEAGEKTFIPAKPKIDIYGADRVFRVCAYSCLHRKRRPAFIL